MRSCGCCGTAASGRCCRAAARGSRARPSCDGRWSARARGWRRARASPPASCGRTRRSRRARTVTRSIVTAGAVVRAGERAADVIVMPRGGARAEAGDGLRGARRDGVGADRVTAKAADTALDAEAALALIRQYLAEREPRRAADVKVLPLSGDASTRRYYRLLLPERSLVLALYPEPFAAGGAELPERARAASSRTGCRCRAPRTWTAAAASCCRRTSATRRCRRCSRARARRAEDRALPRGRRPHRAAAAARGAGAAEGGVLPDRLRHREALLGAALLPEALPRGPAAAPTSRSRIARCCRRRSTSCARRSRPGRACCATATTTAAT